MTQSSSSTTSSSLIASVWSPPAAPPSPRVSFFEGWLAGGLSPSRVSESRSVAATDGSSGVAMLVAGVALAAVAYLFFDRILSPEESSDVDVPRVGTPPNQDSRILRLVLPRRSSPPQVSNTVAETTPTDLARKKILHFLLEQFEGKGYPLLHKKVGELAYEYLIVFKEFLEFLEFSQEKKRESRDVSHLQRRFMLNIAHDYVQVDIDVLSRWMLGDVFPLLYPEREPLIVSDAIIRDLADALLQRIAEISDSLGGSFGDSSTPPNSRSRSVPPGPSHRSPNGGMEPQRSQSESASRNPPPPFPFPSLDDDQKS
jgi:hypothetical protein